MTSSKMNVSKGPHLQMPLQRRAGLQLMYLRQAQTFNHSTEYDFFLIDSKSVCDVPGAGRN